MTNAIRSSLIVLAEPIFPKDDCPKGICHWCGHVIELEDIAKPQHRLRTRHHGDRYEKPLYVEAHAPIHTGEGVVHGGKIAFKKDCSREFKLSMCWSSRQAVRWKCWKNWDRGAVRSNPNAYEVHCVDCSGLCETGFVRANAKRLGFNVRVVNKIQPWEADHIVELADGGAHSVENLEPRCRRCHLDKTRAAAELRRQTQEILDAAGMRTDIPV